MCYWRVSSLVFSLAAVIRAYVAFALEHPHAYEAVMLRAPQNLGERVDVLSKGVSARRETFALCSGVLARGMREGVFSERDVELLSQSIWVTLFGLALRLIREPALSPRRRELLVTETIRTLTDGVLTRTVTGGKK